MTARQVIILDLLCEGLSNQDIADSLGCAEVTVRSHLKKIYDKLNARNGTHAAVLWTRQKLFSLPFTPCS